MRAGFGKSDITPPIGCTLNGFIARLSPSTGVDLPLHARALYLEEGAVRCLVLGMDVLGLTPAFADTMVSDLSGATGVPQHAIILASSHTHSGPMTIPLRGIGPADENYLERLRAGVLQAARTAVDTPFDAQAAWGSAPLSIGVNRRQLDPEGKAFLGVNPDGPRDEVVRVLHVTGKTRSVVLIEHACHPLCFGGDSTVISPDFWGHSAASLEDDGHDVIYLNGCAGDINPRLAFGGAEAASATGRALGDAVRNALVGAIVEPSPQLIVRSSALSLFHDNLRGLDEFDAAGGTQNRTIREAERSDNRICNRIRAAWSQWRTELADAIRSGGPDAGLPMIPARVSVMRVGTGGLIALPGEVFYSIGESIVRTTPSSRTCIAAYCHGFIGYVPDLPAYLRGGYEVEEAHRYLGLWRIDPQAGLILGGAVAALWKGDAS